MKSINLKKIWKIATNFNEPGSYLILTAFMFAIYLFVSAMLYPKPVQLDYITSNMDEGKKVTFYLKEYTTYSREYFVDIADDTYSYTLFIRDIEDAVETLAKYQKDFPKEPMTTFEIIKKNRFIDAFFYFICIFGVYSIYRLYKHVTLKSKDILLEKPTVRFSNIAGIDNILSEVKESVAHFQNSEKLVKLGGKAMKGLMLYGSPGTGKTLLAKAIAGETNSNFIAVSGSQMVELYVGMGAKRVRELFASARDNAPCIIFIDEIDAFALKRGSQRSHSEYDQTVNEMLAQMDGFKDNTGVLVIAATNNLESIDDALLRPGRFDVKLKIELPSLTGRAQILSLYINPNSKMKNIDIQTLAKTTTGFSGADLKNLVDQSIYEALKKNKEEIDMDDFMVAKNKIQMGVQSNIKLSEEDKKSTAYHEIGHAMAAIMFKGPAVSQVSILPRGQSLGQTQFEVEEKTSYSKEDIETQIKILLGGRVAENFYTETLSTGASDDLDKATSLARSLVCTYGMSKFGSINVRFGSQEYQMLSENTKKELDGETFLLINKMMNEVTYGLSTIKPKINELVDMLIEKETLYAEDLKTIYGK